MIHDKQVLFGIPERATSRLDLVRYDPSKATQVRECVMGGRVGGAELSYRQLLFCEQNVITRFSTKSRVLSDGRKTSAAQNDIGQQWSSADGCCF